MKDLFNKPRVFLSHSKKDDQFIERLCGDLRKCQIDPWLDTDEIRHGESWLDAIFENGLPSCESVLVYFSENSIASPVVQKEIDAGIIRKLQDNQIAFLPYVADSTLRTKLRIDIQSLQSPEWNNDNYSQLLPKVVSEIWRSFLERTVTQATQREKIGRLEAELRIQELEKQQESGGFSKSETQDFEYIWGKIDRYEAVEFHHKAGVGESAPELGRYTVRIHVCSLLSELSSSLKFAYDKHDILHIAYDAFRKRIPALSALPTSGSVEVASWPDIGDELLRYGFVSRYQKPASNTDSKVRAFLLRGSSHGLMYTDKLEKFKYWLSRHNRLDESARWTTE